MFELYVEMISGVCVGIELVSGEQIDEPSMDWGIGIDLFILRFVLVKLKEK